MHLGVQLASSTISAQLAWLKKRSEEEKPSRLYSSESIGIREESEYRKLCTGLNEKRIKRLDHYGSWDSQVRSGSQ